MLGTKKLKFILKDKKKLKLILYFFSFFFVFFVSYLNTPKLINYSIDSIKENLKNNNNITINNISKVDYKIFPTPRLILSNSNFTIGEEIFKIGNSNLEIILNISQILSFKKINYKKLLIKKGFSEINLNNVNQLLAVINQNNRKIIFKENNIIFVQKNEVIFEIKNALIKLKQQEKKRELTLRGNFLNNKIFIRFNSSLKNKNNLILKIPELDITAKIFLEKNNFENYNGFVNLEIFNNFFKFNFIKKNNIKLSKGFIRSKLVNTSFKGEVTVKPNFFSRIDFNFSILNMEKLFSLIQKMYFSDDINNLFLIKKINGVFNFKSKFEGRITNKNGEMLFEDFKLGKNKTFLFNGKITEFGKKGKLQFNLVKIIKFQRSPPNRIEITGVLIPSNSKVIFEKFMINGTKLSVKKTKEYESEFKDKIIQNSLANIFSEKKIDKYLKNLF